MPFRGDVERPGLLDFDDEWFTQRWRRLHDRDELKLVYESSWLQSGP